MREITQKIISCYQGSCQKYLGEYMCMKNTNSKKNFEIIRTVQYPPENLQEDEIDDYCQVISKSILEKELEDFFTKLSSCDCRIIETNFEDILKKFEKEYNDFCDKIRWNKPQIFISEILKNKIKAWEGYSEKEKNFFNKIRHEPFVKNWPENQIMLSSNIFCKKIYPTEITKKISVMYDKNSNSITGKISQKLEFESKSIVKVLVNSSRS